MIKITKYMHPETNELWCVETEYMHDGTHVFKAAYDIEGMGIMLHGITLDCLKDVTGQGIAHICINEYPS
jgi:hypothetical protein